jgi:serine protease
MKKRLASLISLLAVAALPLLGLLPGTAFGEGGLPRRSSAPTEDPDGARVIVKYKALGRLMRAQSAAAAGGPVHGPQFAATLAQRSGLALSDGRIIGSRSQVVRGDKTLSSAALAARLAADSDVEYAVPDLRRHALGVPNDPLFAASSSISPAAGQWYLGAPDATLLSAINAVGAWDISTGSPTIVVADVDTGVRTDHPDLVGKLLPGRSFISSSTAVGGSGWTADASDPGDWSTAGECGAGEAATNSSWHGTQTSALIAAQTNNSTGMASVGYNVKLLPVRVLSACGGYDSDIIAGMLWAAGLTLPSSDPSVPANPNPAQVINLSLGSTGSCTVTPTDTSPQAYIDAFTQLRAARVVVVAAAGNDEGLAVGIPANCANVIAVAGLRHTGTKVGYSDIGPEVTISAPAGNCVNSDTPPNSGNYTPTLQCLYPILSATNTGTTTPLSSGNTYTKGYNTTGLDLSLGTSFSTPLVAGTVALMLSANPSLTPAQVTTLLKSSARPFPSSTGVATCVAPTSTAQDECVCTTQTCGAGMLDARAAVSAAAGNPLPTAAITPSATTVIAGATVSFDGSASSVPSGRTIASYRWVITSGSTIASFGGSTSDPTATVLTDAASASGQFTVQLTVTDDSGATATSSATVTVNAAAAPTVSLLSSATVVAAGSPVTFDGSASVAASGLTITAYQWAITAGGTLASFTTATNLATASVATTGSGSGSFTVRLTVTDSAGRQASALQTVNVTAVVPAASIVATPGTVTAGASVALDGSGSSATSPRTIVGYQWTLVGGATLGAFSGSTTGPTATLLTSGAGTVTVQLTVTDSAGATGSAQTALTVQAASTGAGGDSGGGGGGGAVSGAWLVLLAAAVGALVHNRRRAGR